MNGTCLPTVNSIKVEVELLRQMMAGSDATWTRTTQSKAVGVSGTPEIADGFRRRFAENHNLSTDDIDKVNNIQPLRRAVVEKMYWHLLRTYSAL